ncbi:MAG: hypothetical protein ABIC95_01565 [archaeon]
MKQLLKDLLKTEKDGERIIARMETQAAANVEKSKDNAAKVIDDERAALDKERKSRFSKAEKEVVSLTDTISAHGKKETAALGKVTSSTEKQAIERVTDILLH